MADKKISALTSATTPLAGTEVLPIVQSGSTVKVSVADLTVGRSPTMSGASVRSAGAIRFYRGDNAIYSEIYNTTGGSGGCVLNNANSDGFSFQNGGVTQVRINDQGNLAISTAGKGIDFSANGGDVLTQYDEGTWNPTVTSASGTLTSYTASGTYTRIGRMVTAQARVQLTNAGTGAGALIVSNPIAMNSTITAMGCGRDDNTGTMLQARIVPGLNSSIYVLSYNNSTVIATGNDILISISYFV